MASHTNNTLCRWTPIFLPGVASPNGDRESGVTKPINNASSTEGGGVQCRLNSAVARYIWHRLGHQVIM